MNAVGLIPAAGLATRLQPLPCSKEVLVIRGKPVIDYLVERMRRAGCREIRVVTRPEKQDVVRRAMDLGADVVEARPETVGESLVAGLGSAADETPVLIGFPDTLWEPEDGFVSLLERLDEGHELVLGLFRTDDLRRSDVVTVDGAGRVKAIAVKPREAESNLIWGCAVARARVLRGLERWPEPGRYFHELAQARTVMGVELSDTWIDIGTKDALRRASTPPTSGASSAVMTGAGAR